MAIFSDWIVLLIVLHLDRNVIFSDGVGTHYCLAVGNDEGLELDETDEDEELCESDEEEVE